MARNSRAISIDKNLYDELKKEAAMNRRTIRATLEIIIEKALDTKGRQLEFDLDPTLPKRSIYPEGMKV